LTSSGFAGPLNGTVGATTANTGAFTTTTIGTSETLSYGTANGVTYLNGSKVVTSGSALTFDGTNLSNSGYYIGTAATGRLTKSNTTGRNVFTGGTTGGVTDGAYIITEGYDYGGTAAGGAINLVTAGASSPITFLINGTEGMRLTSTGLGIGTSSPSAKLHVSGGASYITGASNGTAQLQFFNNAQTTSGFQVGQGYASNTDNIGYVYNTANAAIAFGTNNTERMRIDSSGIVGVATTTPNTAFQMTVAGTGFVTNRVNIGDVAGFSDGSTIICGSDGTNSSSWNQSNADYRFGSNRGGCVVAINPGGYTYEGGSGTGTRTFAVNSNGNVQNTNNSYGSLSDAKLKENIVDASPKLDDLMRVKIRNFNLIADEAKTKQIGVVAQELEEIFPSMIEEHIDYTFESYVREDGVADSRGIPTGTITKEVKYSVFVPMLIKAMQEQQALIQDLTTRLAALEAK
jgi:hypothetical protein